MTDCFPDVVMPTAPPPEPEEPLPLTDDVIQEQMDADEAEDETYLEVDEISEEEEDIIPEPKRRPKLTQDEIFTKELPKVKSVLDPEEPLIPPEPTQKKTGRGSVGQGTRKKRGPCTPEQLERLAKGRAKAAETRARKKKEKEDNKAKEKEDKELVEAIRQRERVKLKKRLSKPIEEDDDEPHRVPKVQIVEKPVVVEKGYSQADLDGAVQRAVEQSVNRVEVLRKQRKKVKADAQAKAKHDAQVFKEINSALKNDVWANCFL
tara:strand:- start:7107 stop:7895 length:789 start_codon:yes stop_codon:yes gene_type:complete